MPAKPLHIQIIRVLRSTVGGGAFVEEREPATGGVLTHHVSWVTGMASSFAQSDYVAQFGELPDWVAALHPSHRSQLCRLALGTEQPLPVERPEGSEGLGALSVPYLGTDDHLASGRAAIKRSRNPRFALVQEALQEAATLEQRLAPFQLKGRGAENRVSVDRQLANVLRAIELPHCRLSGYGPTCYYPERVFRRAAAQLRERTGDDVLISDRQGTRYRINEP